jgi:hypothetical protein
MKEALDRARIYYATGFFLTVEPEALIHMGKKALEENKVRFFWFSVLEQGVRC